MPLSLVVELDMGLSVIRMGMSLLTLLYVQFWVLGLGIG